MSEKSKECEELLSQLTASKAAVDRLAKSLRAGKEREEDLATAKQQGDLAIEQV